MRAKMAYLLFPSSCYFLLPLPLSSCCFPPLFSFFSVVFSLFPSLFFLLCCRLSLSLLFIWQMLHGNSWTRDVWDRWSGCARLPATGRASQQANKSAAENVYMSEGNVCRCGPWTGWGHGLNTVKIQGRPWEMIPIWWTLTHQCVQHISITACWKQ